MSRFKKLIHEVHRRSIWQVLLVYLGASYAILEAVDLFTERWGLPSWLFTAAAVLLVVGLLVVLTAAILPDTVEEVETSAEAAAALGAPGGRRLTLRVMLGAVLVLAAGALATILLIPRSDPNLDPNVLAVAPFDVLDPDLEVWREGMVDVLSAGLDGAAPCEPSRPPPWSSAGAAERTAHRRFTWRRRREPGSSSTVGSLAQGPTRSGWPPRFSTPVSINRSPSSPTSAI
ncbi:MAG: hypothetical protein GTO46_07285 [Gemmatimonadetes bacterium]|nr:hypothetical protein [Gemmatimonadota bacterium]NIO31434.1 hypothetical protein [Gemmatimonadota bacterium]